MDFTPALEGLDERERVYVEARLCGLSAPKAAAAAGKPTTEGQHFERKPAVIAAIAKGRAISCEATGITRQKVTDMLMDAYRAAATATEMVFAARELAKLHGLYAPQQVEIDHKHRLAGVKTDKDMKLLSVEDLERLAQQRGDDAIDVEYETVKVIEHARAT